MAGTGVLEGWTQYIWHFVKEELLSEQGQGALE